VNRKKLKVFGSVGAVIVIGAALAGQIFFKNRMNERFQKNCVSVVRANCKAHHEAGCSRSGSYSVSLDETGKGYTAYCEMDTDGGGWMLVLDYLHQGGSNPALKMLKSSDGFPVLHSSKLGDDGTKSEDWGQVSTEWLATLPFSEVRFYCKTSGHGRVMDFKVAAKSCNDYFRTGKGSCFKDIAATGVPLNGSNAHLPKEAADGFKDQGALALDSFPFYKSRFNHWGIAGEGTRWECDDMPYGPGNNTQHLVFIR
jgi:hypothetical protein